MWVFYVKFLSSKIFDDKLFGYSYLLLTQSARIKVERIDRYQFYLMKFADFLEDRASVTDRGVLYFPQRTVPRVPFRGWFRASVDSDLRGLPRGWHVFGLDILAASAWWFAVVLAFCVLRLGVEKFIILIYKILIDRAKIKSINSIFVFPLLKKINKIENHISLHRWKKNFSKSKIDWFNPYDCWKMDRNKILSIKRIFLPISYIINFTIDDKKAKLSLLCISDVQTNQKVTRAINLSSIDSRLWYLAHFRSYIKSEISDFCSI